MAGLTILNGTKGRFDTFKMGMDCGASVAIDILLRDHQLAESLQRENSLLWGELGRLKEENARLNGEEVHGND